MYPYSDQVMFGMETVLKNIVRLLIGLIFSCVLIGNAAAQWAYQEQDASAFSDEKIHMILSIKNDRGLGVRCQNGKSELMFMLPEKIDQIGTMNALKPKLLFRVDKNEPYELPALAHDSNGTLMLMAWAEQSVIEEIKDAKQRIAVLLDIAGTQLSETRYSVKGSTKAANQLLKNCKPKDVE